MTPGALDPTMTPGTPIAGVGAGPATPATHSIGDHDEQPPAPEIPGYTVTGLLGQGGMGAVFAATQTAIDRPVAIKVMNQRVAGSSDAAQRFLREARAAGRVHHPNVVTIFDAGECPQGWYMVLEFVAGGDARQLANAQGGRLPVERALQVIRDAAQGLAALHAVGVLHRDIKPANLFVSEDGTTKLADLGLARPDSADEQMTTAGTTMGTPAYMSPEQARAADDLDGRTDIYALGATLFALVCGEPPFTGSSTWAVVASVLNDPTPDPRHLRPDLSPSVADLIGRCMAKDRALRPADATMLANVCQNLLDGLAPTPLDSGVAAQVTETIISGQRTAAPLATTEPSLAPVTGGFPRVLVWPAIIAPIVVATIVAAVLLSDGNPAAVDPTTAADGPGLTAGDATAGRAPDSPVDTPAGTGSTAAINPMERYIEARTAMENGDAFAARASFESAIELGLPYVDAQLDYARLVRLQDGLGVAQSRLQAMASAGDPIAALVAASLRDDNERSEALAAVLAEHPGLGPGWWLYAQSLGPGPQAPYPTLRQLRAEQQAAERFVQTEASGELVPLMADRSLAIQWLSEARSRLVEIAAFSHQMANPVTFQAMSHNAGWNVIATVQDPGGALAIQWQVGAEGEWQAGDWLPQHDPRTGRPMPNPALPLPKQAGPNQISVRYQDAIGAWSDPVRWQFVPASAEVAQAKQILGLIRHSWISWREWDGQLLVYFTALLAHGSGLSEIRYGVDQPTPDQVFPVPEDGSIPDQPWITVPSTTSMLSVQVVFRDGSESDIQALRRSDQ